MKKNKGITLVALIITIIVLLILAGVTISLILGDNGILNRAKESGEEYIKASIKEEIELTIADIAAELSSKTPPEGLSNQVIIDKIADKIQDITIDDTLKGEYRGYEYLIDENYEVHIGNKVDKTLTMKVEKKVGTSYVTVTVTAKSTVGEIVGYIYVVDGVETEQKTENIYTAEDFEPESNHTIKAIAIDEKGNRKEGMTYRFKTEPRLYIYQDGKFDSLIGGITYAGYHPKLYGNVSVGSSYFTVRNTAQNTLVYSRTQNQVNLTDYAKIGAEMDVTDYYSSIFLSTVSFYGGQNTLGNLDCYTSNINLHNPGKKTVAKVDVSKVNQNAYIFFNQYHVGVTNVYTIWLEK